MLSLARCEFIVLTVLTGSRVRLSSNVLEIDGLRVSEAENFRCAASSGAARLHSRGAECILYSGSGGKSGGRDPADQGIHPGPPERGWQAAAAAVRRCAASRLKSM